MLLLPSGSDQQRSANPTWRLTTEEIPASQPRCRPPRNPYGAAAWRWCSSRLLPLLQVSEHLLKAIQVGDMVQVHLDAKLLFDDVDQRDGSHRIPVGNCVLRCAGDVFLT